jgi:hypothetical protein
MKPIPPVRLIIPSAAAGACGLLLSAVAFTLDPASAVRGWYFASLFFLGLSLGAMALLAIHGLTGGNWGLALRQPLRAIAAMLPLLALAFLPLVLSLDTILPWREAATLDHLAAAKLVYMHTPFLVLRLSACLAAFIVASGFAGVWSGTTPSPRGAVAALILWALGLLIFSTDWMVAPDPHFYSTIYPVLEAGAEMLGALTLAILLATLVLPFANKITGKETNTRLSEDLANLLFGFLLLLVYLAFMQWLVIWSGNLPEEIGWYIARSAAGWPLVLMAVVVMTALAAAGFLYRPLKASAAGLAALAGLVLAATFLHTLWRLAPGIAAPRVWWPDAAAVLGVGGIWMAGCLRLLAGRPLPQLEPAK